MIDAGTIAAKLVLSTNPFTASMEAARLQLSDFADSSKSVGERMNSLGTAMQTTGKMATLGLTVPILGIGAAATKSAADFEQGMSNVKAVSGATSEEMKQLSGLALQMGKDTSFSAGEAAKGIEELIKAGVSVTDIMGGGLAGALDLAAAGEIDLADAAEIASTVLNAFKNDNLSVTDAANLLAGAANASATSVGEMKYGLSNVSAVASSVGMSFKDTATALAVFAQNGIKGSDAGTSLKTMLLNLQPQTKEQNALFKELNLVTEEGNSKFFDAQGHIKSLAEIAELLQTSMSGLTDAQRLQAMQTIFGSDAIRASNVLFKEGAEGVNTMYEAMSKITAADVAKERLNNLNGTIEQMKGSLETAGIAIGTVIVPVIKELADKVTVLVNKFLELDPETQEFIVKAGLMAAAVGPLTFTIGKLTSGVGGAINLVKGLGTAFTTLAPLATGAATATAGAGTAAAAAGASGGIAAAGGIASLAGGLGTLAVAAAPWLIAGAAVAGTGHMINKTMSQEAIPAVDLFADKVVTTEAKVTEAHARMSSSIETTVTKIGAETTKAVGEYIKLDDDATRALMNLQANSTTITEQISTTLTGKFNSMGSQIKTGMDKHYKDTYATIETFFKNSDALASTEEAAALQKLKDSNEAKKKTVDEGTKQIKAILEQAAKDKRELTLQEQRDIAKIQEDMKTDAVKALSETELESKVILERLKSYSARITAEQTAEIVKNANTTRDKGVQAANEQYDKTVKAIIKMRDETGTITADQAEKLIKSATKQKESSIAEAEKMRSGVIDKIKAMNPDIVEEVNLQTGSIMTGWQKLKNWWDGLIFGKKTMEVEHITRNTTYNSTINSSEDRKSGIKQYAVGSNYIPYDQVAMIHEGEAIIPKKFNPWAGGGGVNLGGNPITINVTTNNPDRIVRELNNALGGGAI